jgi:hypothetical protein
VFTTLGETINAIHILRKLQHDGVEYDANLAKRTCEYCLRNRLLPEDKVNKLRGSGGPSGMTSPFETTNIDNQRPPSSSPSPPPSPPSSSTTIMHSAPSPVSSSTASNSKRESNDRVFRAPKPSATESQQQPYDNSNHYYNNHLYHNVAHPNTTQYPGTSINHVNNMYNAAYATASPTYMHRPSYQQQALYHPPHIMNGHNQPYPVIYMPSNVVFVGNPQQQMAALPTMGMSDSSSAHTGPPVILYPLSVSSSDNSPYNYPSPMMSSTPYWGYQQPAPSSSDDDSDTNQDS